MTLRIAISGGGIAGLTTAIALRTLPDVDVQVYEQAQKFREIGASIGIGPNGLRTLEKLGVDNALAEGKACRRQRGEHHQVYRHWKTGAVLDVDTNKNLTTKQHDTARFHRAHLHAALLEHVPSDTIHLGKRTERVEVHEDDVTLVFADGTTATADFIVGADGIHSNIRKFFVPEHQLHWTGWVAMRSAFDASLLDSLDRSLVPDDAAHWIGPGGRSFFHGHLGQGQFTTVGGFIADPANPPSAYRNTRWEDEGSLQHLRSLYDGWHPIVTELLAHTPYTKLYPNVAGDPLKTWVFADGRATLVGDAAHTHGGAFAAGGSLAMDDAYALMLALQYVWPKDRKPTGKELNHALHLYERTRKPHVEKVMAFARHQIIGKRRAESKGDEKKEGSETKEGEKNTDKEDQELLAFVKSRPDTTWINDHDVEQTFRNVVEEEKQDPPPRGHL